MLSKNQIKLIKRLSQKKYRDEDGLFVVEGVKGIEEFLSSDFDLKHLYTTDTRFDVDTSLQSEISTADLKKISQLKSPNKALAVFEKPKPKPIDDSKLIVALDDVRDPGNLGTIIRLCDWFGVQDLVCSLETVDCYNPKVVQASMGSLTRVNISYINLKEFLEQSQAETIGTFLDSPSIYESELSSNAGILVMGNEANGISEGVSNLISKRITIPQYGNKKATESLNVATATSICLAEIKRRIT
ncbi:RNA methyltransferase [Winogradskyella maritima]|uniref:TrmH family RNA methyltransferase n=1 Tax=Winogradskyella maritima TaxID=1517766 RepID=A0ABV8AJR0_9FLAO|nr:RNA methyltransferase [Winogradskyella maritima]